MLELRRWLPEDLEPWVYDGVTVYGPIRGDRLDEGQIEYRDGQHRFRLEGQRSPKDYPVLRQLMLAARIAVDRWYYDDDRAKAQRALAEDVVARQQPGMPAIQDVLAAIDRPRHLFSPNFSADAPYNYYLFMLRDADLHYIFLEDWNSGMDMLGFIDGRTTLPEATVGSVGLLKRWFREVNTIGVPEMIDFGLLDAAAVEEILRASPYFEESRADLTDEEWESLMRTGSQYSSGPPNLAGR